MIAALEKRQPAGAVPVWEIEFQAWDAVSGRHIVLGEEFASLGPAAQERALAENAEILLLVCEEMHFAALSPPGGYWEIAPGVPSYYWLPPEARLREIEILRRLAPPDLLLVANTGGVMAMPGAENYVSFAYLLYDAPAEVDALAERSLQGGLQAARRFRDLGMDIAVTASDVADNHGPYMQPKLMERFVWPYLRRFAAGVKAMGLYSVIHSDGNLTSCLEAIATSGVDALQAVDPTAGMDMREARQIAAGRLCLCGNINCGLLVTGTPEEVYMATQELLLTCKTGGGLVLGSSNAVQPEVPAENYRAMIAAWQDHGRY
jgi:uroporphyrinogen decarboxylase